jgi:tetratricopeptide (TPR) repeat protein
LARAEALLKQNKLDQAIASLNELCRRSPKPPGAEAQLGKALYAKRDYPQAAAHLELALQEKPTDGEATQLLGLSYYLMGNSEKAIPLLEKVQALLRRPDVTGSYLLGITYLQTQQYDKARAAFAKMFAVPPESPNAHLVLGQMMLRQEIEEKAVPELKRALELDPRLPMAHFLLGEIYLFRSNVGPALEEFQKELALNPVMWLAYWRLGDAYTRLEQWNEAEQALKQAIWLNQNFTGPFILMGKVQMKKGSPDLAAGFLERALKMDPNNYLAHYLLGQAYQQLGRSEDAKREFELTRTLREVKDQ